MSALYGAVAMDVVEAGLIFVENLPVVASIPTMIYSELLCENALEMDPADPSALSAIEKAIKKLTGMAHFDAMVFFPKLLLKKAVALSFVGRVAEALKLIAGVAGVAAARALFWVAYAEVLANVEGKQVEALIALEVGACCHTTSFHLLSFLSVFSDFELLFSCLQRTPSSRSSTAARRCCDRS